METDGKVQALNYAIRNAIPDMRKVADENPNAKVLVRAIKFSNGAQWHVSQPTDVADFEWTDLKAGGVTDMGKALSMALDGRGSTQDTAHDRSRVAARPGADL
jgi:uncharacterized protein YegL